MTAPSTTPRRLYFDHNASAPLRDQARSAMARALEHPGNPSSVHAEGRELRRIIEDAREEIAALVGARPAEVVFTSGASEANNWVAGGRWDRIYVFAIEHESVLAPVRASGAEVIELPVSADGTTDLGAFAHHVLTAPDLPPRTLLTLQMANSETGVVQDLAAAAEFCRAHDVAVHCDAVQAAGRLAIDFAGLGIDLMTLSSHKIGGPMGVGALVIRDGLDIANLLRGGGQERRRRAGTENVAAIAGFAAAAREAAAEIAGMARLADLRDRLADGIRALVPGAGIVGERSVRLANTLCVTLPGVAAETAVIKLDLAGIAASAGSACASGKVGASHVLAAMGLGEAEARCAIRLSLGWTTGEADIEEVLARLAGLGLAGSTPANDRTSVSGRRSEAGRDTPHEGTPGARQVA